MWDQFDNLARYSWLLFLFPILLVTLDRAKQIFHRGVNSKSGHAEEKAEVAPDVRQEVAPRVEIDLFYGLNRGTGTECRKEGKSFSISNLCFLPFPSNFSDLIVFTQTDTLL